VALALHHKEDCGISFVATVPKARRKGLASQVMRQALQEARRQGCTTTTLQATEVGEKLYVKLGYRHLCVMQLWERRP
jgi:predicted acetyltransferase